MSSSGSDPMATLNEIARAAWVMARERGSDYDGSTPETATSRGVPVLTGAMIMWAIEDETRVPIGGDDTNASISRVLRIERWTDASGPAVTLTIDSSDGTPRPRDLRIAQPSPAALDKLRLTTFIEQGAAQMTRSLRRTIDGDHLFDPPVGVLTPFDDAVRLVRRARRSWKDDETLARTVKAWQSTTGGGRIAAVMDELNLTSERQARRYVQRAQEVGLLERERAPRKTKKAES